MKRICLSCIMFFIMCMQVDAENLPILQLDNGINDISLTLSANFQDLRDVRVDVDPALLPKWLSVAKSLDVVDVKKGESSEKQLTIRFIVDETSQETSLVVPFTLSNGEGRSWTFRAVLQINSNKPTETALYNNFPNPFNPSTTIRFSLKDKTDAKIVIYNSLGQVVRILVNGSLSAGKYSVQWNCVNEHGQKVASGLYFYTITAGSFKQTKRMMVTE